MAQASLTPWNMATSLMAVRRLNPIVYTVLF
jgi:hypothetical protein